MKPKNYENLLMEVNANLYLIDRKALEFMVLRKKSTIIRVVKNIVHWFLVSTTSILLC